jgi:hypothetical protein
MHKIDTDSAVNGLFVEKDPALGLPATEVSADILNALQEEIVNTIEATGAVLNKTNNSQLASAVASLVSPGASSKNVLTNGGLSVVQRFSHLKFQQTVAVHSLYSSTRADEEFHCDRWRHDRPTSGGFSDYEHFRHPADISSEELPQVQNTDATYLKIRVPSTVYNSGALPSMFQRVEGVKTLAGLSVVFSFYARINSGTSTVTPSVTQNFGDSGTASADVVLTGSPLTLTSSWARYEVSFVLGTLVGKTIAVGSDFLPCDYLEARLAFATNSLFDIDVSNFQLESGTIATLWEPELFGPELLECMRFFEMSPGIERSNYQTVGLPQTNGCVNGLWEDDGTKKLLAANSQFRVMKRRTPDVTFWRPGGTVVDQLTWDAIVRTVSSVSESSTSSTGSPLCATAPTGVKRFECLWSATAELEDN